MSSASPVIPLISKLRYLLCMLIRGVLVECRGQSSDRRFLSDARLIWRLESENCREVVKSVQSIAYRRWAAHESNEGDANSPCRISAERRSLSLMVAFLLVPSVQVTKNQKVFCLTEAYAN